jgi:type I restriction enzyme S subunit
MSGVAEVSSTYLAEMASNSIPVGYKQTEVGVIPEDWQLSNIRDVSAIPMQNGLFYEPKRKGKGVPLINVGDMYTAAPVDVDSLELFNATAGEIKVFRVVRGDLFFTRSSVVPSGIAYCNIFDSEREDVVFDSHLIRVRPNTEILEPRYLYLNCIAKHCRTALIAEAKTATMTTIDQGAINRCPVLVPPKKERVSGLNG